MKKPKRLTITTSPVKSSAIAAIGHDPSTNTLRVEFSSGHAYDYPNVSADEYSKLLASDSLGKHFYKHFRGRDCCKLEHDEAA